MDRGGDNTPPSNENKVSMFTLPNFIKRMLLYFSAATFLCGFGAGAISTAAALEEAVFEDGLALLLERSFSEKSTAIEKLAQSGDERAENILRVLLSGDLYYVKADKTLVFAKAKGRNYTIRAVLTDEDLGTVKKRKLKKISINNNLRVQLKSVLARLGLSHPDAAVRLAAINKMLPTLTPELHDALHRLHQTEKDSTVKAALKSAMAITVLRQEGESAIEERLMALDQLAGNLHPAVHNELTRLLESDAHQDIHDTVKAVLQGIETRRTLFKLFETIFFGLSLGSVLVLAAIGLAITFGVIGIINMAHGELIMLGAYTTYMLQQMLPNAIGTALVLAIPAAFLVSGLVGIVIERTVIRFLYGRPLETLLATFGISLILQQAVRSIFSPLNRSVSTPAWMSGSIQLNAVLSLTTNRVVILIFALLVFAGLALLLKKSAMGLHVRAVSQNRAMAQAMGVKAARVDALTFGLGSGIAGIAGGALSQLTNVGPNLGQAYIVDSFMVVVFGGVGNLWGTLLGGLSLGVTNKFLEPWTGAVLAKIFILFFIILFIQKRPQGLFPQKGRAAG